MKEIPGMQKTGLTRKFKRCPIDLEGMAAGTRVMADVEDFIRYIDRVTFEDGVMYIWWMGRCGRDECIVFRSVYVPAELWEADRDILREMWRCGTKAPRSIEAAEDGGDF